ncbi:MAG: leucine-rich repeat domain-containing protein, partial [Candidatus Methanomethylophilaceae archaeon]|nr:leucine-rich repeat domain-containing protein [Candidatus Methanomethylophilaceae archaeon]MBR3477316.1 leucine-rich repeat domain-containing protein [Candidatus Methanomethylophilaceae archaeon]
HAEGCSIGYKAFANCSALERMELASVPDIGQYAFANCSSLERADLGDCLASVGKSAFSGCTAICSISFPDVLETVGETAFHGLKFYAHDGTTALSPTPANLSGKTFEGTSKALVQTA